MQFLETFTGNTGKDRFRVGAWHRERDGFGWDKDYWVSSDPWPADHATNHDDCGPATDDHPQAARTAGDWPAPITFLDSETAYVCRDHLMSTMGDVSGYSVQWFSPTRVFDDITEVCWDVSIGQELTGDRQWWEVAVQPAKTQDVSAVDWLAGTANSPTYGDVDAVVAGFGPAAPLYYQLHVGDGASYSAGMPNTGTAESDQSIRRPHCLRDNGNGTLTFSTVNADGTAWSFSGAGSFPAGPLKVVFKSHAYTPSKSCWQFANSVCASYSWHWDNIKVT